MINDIRKAADVVNAYLTQHGPQYTDELLLRLIQEDDLLERAIGWLACEAKIVISMEDDRELISLVS